MIVNKYTNGGGSSSAITEGYWTSAQTEEHIESAASIVYGSATSYTDQAISGIDLSAYALSADVESLSAVVQEQQIVFSSGYNELHTQVMELSGDVQSLSAATAGKADAANVTPRSGRYFPNWNAQGIITGSTNMAWLVSDIVNGKVRKQLLSNLEGAGFGIYAPESVGTAGDILVSTGNGAPVWSAVTMGGVSQEYVDSATTILQDQLDIIDDVIPAAIVDLNERVDGFSDIELPISAAVNKLKGDFEARLDQQYYKKQETNNLLKEKVTAGQVDVRIKNYTDPLFQAVYETIEDKELPISAALNELNEAIDLIDEVVPAAIVDLNNRVDEISGATPSIDLSAFWTSAQTQTAITTATQNMVTSTYVSTIWKGTQAAYDQLSVKDPETFYIIVNE